MSVDASSAGGMVQLLAATPPACLNLAASGLQSNSLISERLPQPTSVKSVGGQQRRRHYQGVAAEGQWAAVVAICGAAVCVFALAIIVLAT